MAIDERACVVWGGDVVLARRQHYVSRKLGFDRVLSLPTLKSADLAVVNLECVIATSGQQGTDKGEGGPFYFRGRPELLRILAEAGVHVVTTANNHSGDYGTDALLEQLNRLRDAGFASAGSGVNIGTAFAPVICRAGNLNVALLSVDATQASFAATEERPGTAYLPLNAPDAWKTKLAPLIAEAKRQAHVVLVAVHWGPNYVNKPSDAARKIGRLLVDIGADAVLGASAHVLHGIEIHNERPIIYDAGNLLFDAIRQKPDDCGLFKLDVTSDGIRQLTFIPVAGWTGYSAERQGEDAREACRRYAEKCAELGTRLEGEDRLTITLKPEGRTPSTCEPAPRIAPDLGAASGKNDVSGLWRMGSVPHDAACQPVSIGPLTLVGLRVWPKLITTRQMLWIETFWRTDQRVDQDLRIDLRATPVDKSRMRAWGELTDHDPCDWLLPTSDWRPGEVYRDFYGLRPPYLDEWENVDLQVSVGLVSNTENFPAIKTGHMVRLAVPQEKLGRSADASQKASSSISGWTGKMIEEVTGGTWLVPPPEGWTAKSFSFSGELKLRPPSMYVAYNAADRAHHENYTSPTTETWDRHNRIPQLSKDKAAFCGALVGRAVPDAARDFPMLQVDDPLKAALKLGRAARDRFNGHVVGVTGTVGKSSTVAMIATMIGKERTLTTQGNFNTRVGTVLALSNLNSSYDAAVLEVAQSSLWMNSGPITRTVRPTAAIVTSIELSQPGSIIRTVEDVAEYKSRIFDGLTGPKIAVLPDYIKFFDKILGVASRHAARVVICGYSDKAEVRILSIDEDWDRTTIDLQLPSGRRQLVVPVLSQGMAENAVGAFTMLYAMGYDLDKSTAALAGYEPEKGRLQRHEVTLPEGGRVEIFDDSFNAEVTSMINGFRLLGKRQLPAGGRRVGVLGRIGYLGDRAPDMHESLAEPLIENKFDFIVTHGPEMVYLREKLPPSMLGEHFSDAKSLVNYLAAQLAGGDLVLIKGGQVDTDFGTVPDLLLSRLAPQS